MKEAIIDIKMNPHRPKKPASDESTTDEEEMIVYDVEDEIESNPDYVKQKCRIVVIRPSTPMVETCRLRWLWSRLKILCTSTLAAFSLPKRRHLPCALQLIDSLMPRKYRIYTDSMSVLKRLRKLPRSLPSSGMYNTDITSRLYSKGLDIVFCYWLPSHVGISRQRASGQRGMATTHPPLAVSPYRI
ncbi:hypothetical protein TNCV_3314041 [Trichonephila clavipes]|nr:hypothetical protein TNCV_3314041 [Trichonephila clavipes]